jgi:large subunit ribosomal protein L32e
MMADAKLLAIKKKLNKKRPDFIRQDYYHRMRVEDEFWRRPRGRHSKMRERRTGKRKRVEIGYRGPAELRGLHFSGMKLVNVVNLVQLAKINPKEEVAIINSNIGNRKRYQLVKFASEKSIKLLNIKDPGKFLLAADAELKARKEARNQRATEKKVVEEKKPESKKPEAKPVASEIKKEASTQKAHTVSEGKKSTSAGLTESKQVKKQ